MQRGLGNLKVFLTVQHVVSHSVFTATVRESRAVIMIHAVQTRTQNGKWQGQRRATVDIRRPCASICCAGDTDEMLQGTSAAGSRPRKLFAL